MLVNVRSHSCTITWLTAFSFGLHRSKRHHDIQNSRESPNASNCWITVRSLRLNLILNLILSLILILILDLCVFWYYFSLFCISACTDDWPSRVSIRRCRLVVLYMLNCLHFPAKKSQIHIDVSHSRQPLVKGERLVRYAVNTVMLGNVGSHSCTIIWLTAFSFGLHPSKRHHDIGFAEFQGITEYIELRNSKNMLELGGS